MWFDRICIVTENEHFTSLVMALWEIKMLKMLMEVMLSLMLIVCSLDWVREGKNILYMLSGAASVNELERLKWHENVIIMGKHYWNRLSYFVNWSGDRNLLFVTIIGCEQGHWLQGASCWTCTTLGFWHHFLSYI